MRRTVVGVIAVVAATSVFTMTGLGQASAAAALPNSPASATSGFSPSSEAAVLKTLHDNLSDQWDARDAYGMQTTQAALAGELARLAAPAGHAAMAPDAVTTAGRAQRENTQLGRDLAALTATHGKAASDLPVPGLGSLMTLIQSLLATLLSLITGLLGGLPVPVPPVGVPALPVGVPTPPPAH
jgi:hypothetical protein